MAQAIRAIYEDGHLRLLDLVDLREGEQVEVTVVHQFSEPLTETDRIRMALGGSVRFPSPASTTSENDDFDFEALQRELDAALQGSPPVSEYIIQERREGP